MVPGHIQLSSWLPSGGKFQLKIVGYRHISENNNNIVDSLLTSHQEVVALDNCLRQIFVVEGCQVNRHFFINFKEKNGSDSSSLELHCTDGKFIRFVASQSCIWGGGGHRGAFAPPLAPPNAFTAFTSHLTPILTLSSHHNIIRA